MNRPFLGSTIVVLVASWCSPVWSVQSQTSPSGVGSKGTLAANDNLASSKGKEGAAAAAPGARPLDPPIDPATYIVGAEDSLQISVWREPELTVNVIVRPDGMISMPLLNDVKAVGLRPLELQAIITDRLKPFVNDPQVTIIVTGIHSRSVYLMGQVNRQGSYGLNGQKTVLQLLADAGGPSQFAKVGSIYIARRVNGRLTRIPFKYKQALKDLKFDIELQPGDEVIVP